MNVELLKWLQLLQTILIFILPALLVAIFAGRREGMSPMAWWRLDRCPDWRTTLCWMGLVVLASPGVNLLGDLNQQVHVPESWSALEAHLRAQEDTAAQITMLFLRPNHWYDLFINLGLMALLPAFAEELTFRGTMTRWQSHACVWTVAIIFSAVHMQFFGFIPRMLLGAWFGYVYIWTGNLWVTMLMHFTNNTLAVIGYHYAFTTGMDVESMSAFGAGDTWYVGVVSLILTVAGVILLKKKIEK